MNKLSREREAWKALEATREATREACKERLRDWDNWKTYIETKEAEEKAWAAWGDTWDEVQSTLG